jgi:hypothetical protein
MDCSTGEGGKNRDKKIVMVKLIQKKHSVQEQQKVQSLGKSSGVIP